MNIKRLQFTDSIEYDDAHSNYEDYPAIGLLVSALVTRQIDATVLFAPPATANSPKTKTGNYAAYKATVINSSYYDEEDDKRLPSMKELQRRLRLEFKNYLGDNNFVRRFLNGVRTMNYAFACDAKNFVKGSREYELGELIAEEFDIEAGVDLMKLKALSFEFFCRYIMKVLTAIDAANNKPKSRKSTETKKRVKGKADAEADRKAKATKRKLSKAEHAKANAELDGDDAVASKKTSADTDGRVGANWVFGDPAFDI